MKELLLYRHAKAEKSVPGGGDRERPLAPKGELQARAMGKLLRDADALPEVVLTSDAVRALTTAALTLGESGCSAPVHSSTALYDAEPDDYAQELASLDVDADRVMIVGHNPTMEEFASRMLGRRVEMKTAHLLRLSVDIGDWKDFSPEASVTSDSLLAPDIA